VPSSTSTTLGLAVGIVCLTMAVGGVATMWGRSKGLITCKPDDRKAVRIGTRGSALAMVQTEYVAAMLQKNFPDVRFHITKGIQAHGDQVLDVPLKDIVVKTPGLFTKELGWCMVAFHSLILRKTH